MIKVTVTPLSGALGVKFGDSRDRVREVFGKHNTFKKASTSKNTADDFGFCHVFYDKQDKVIYIEFIDHCEVSIGSIKFFPTDVKELIMKLTKSSQFSFEISQGQITDYEKSLAFTLTPDGSVECVGCGVKGYFE